MRPESRRPPASALGTIHGQLILDQIGEAITDLSSRAGRTLLLVLAIGLSLGAMVSGVSLGWASSSQVRQDLAASILSTIVVTPRATSDENNTAAFTAESLQAVEAIPMIECAGTALEVPTDLARLGRTPNARLVVQGVTSGYLCAQGVREARGLEQLDGASPLRIAVLGSTAAEILGVPPGFHDGSYRITVSGQERAVAAVLEPSGSSADTTVFIPYSAARAQLGSDEMAQLLIHTEPGAGGTVSRIVRNAVLPSGPQLYEVNYVNDIAEVRSTVGSQLSRMIVAVGIALAIVTVLLMASAMANTVAHKHAEIGLRRALGYSRSDIAALFLTEGALIGLLGGLVGVGLGNLLAATAAVLNSWTPQFSMVLAVSGLLAAVVLGAVAALLPALNAARLRPATSLRSE